MKVGDHADSMGHRVVMCEVDTIWMTAGEGITSEMFLLNENDANRSRAFQIGKSAKLKTKWYRRIITCVE